jgi:hypothetical protein
MDYPAGSGGGGEVHNHGEAGRLQEQDQEEEGSHSLQGILCTVHISHAKLGKRGFSPRYTVHCTHISCQARNRRDLYQGNTYLISS